MDLRSFGPYNIFLLTDRSIYCHMTRSDMNYLLYSCLIEIIISVHKQENPMGHMTVFQNQTQNQKGPSWSLSHGSWILPVQSAPVITKVVSSNPVHGEVH